MRPNVLISSGTGTGRPADEALLAGALRLLQRGAYEELVALSHDPEVSARFHTNIRLISHDEIHVALAQSRMLVVVGDLRTPAELERAALHVALAKLACIPVALVSVRLGERTNNRSWNGLMQILAQSESISTCDGNSAHILSHLRGSRVETTAAIELVLPTERRPLPASLTIGISEECLLSCDENQRRRLISACRAFARRSGARVLVVNASATDSDWEEPDVERITVRTWSEWIGAISACRAFIAEADSVALHLAAANGTVPLACVRGLQESDLHARLGLPELTCCAAAGAAGWSDVLTHAFASGREEVRARCSPLRVVAWRALGQISEATRSQRINLGGWNDEARAFLAGALRLRLRPFLEQGDVLTCEAELQGWERELHVQAAWAEARARVWALQGRDREARCVLEHALAEHPDDVDCLAELAMVAFRLGDYRTSESCWKCVQALEPDSTRASSQLACVQWFSGNGEALQPSWFDDEVHHASETPSRASFQTSAGQRATAQTHGGLGALGEPHLPPRADTGAR